jgi:UDP-glucose:(heptosyl)LPS alpha-1,3-glucosyltransferase
MKIALVLDRFDPRGGGLEKWTAGFACHLTDAGHDVHVLTFEQAEHVLPVTVHILPPARGVLDRARQVELGVALLRPDMAHDTGVSWSGDIFHPQTGSRLASLDQFLASLPFILRIKTRISPNMRKLRRDLARLEEVQMARARRVVAVSRSLRARFAERHALPESRIAVIPNGAETTRFAAAAIAPMREAERARLGLKRAEVLFLLVAHNLKLKGLDIALAAMASLAANGCDARLAVAGGSPGRAWRRLANRLGLARRVLFLGPVDAMEALFAAADCCVHPTRWDACSLSTIEAMAAGLPVITTAMNGASELITHGETGFVMADPDDVASLAGFMRILMDEDVRRRMGNKAGDAASHFDVTGNYRAVEALMLSMGTRAGSA